MRLLRVNEKTGFRITDKKIPVVIRDNRGILFYDNSVLDNPVSFNIIPDIDLVVESGRFTKMDLPVKIPYLSQPKPMRKNENPEGFTIKYGNVKYKCCILWDEKLILIDNQFKDKPYYQIMYLVFHEFGHRYYDGSLKGEISCDIYAANKMIKMGFNESQIAQGIYSSLSDKNDERKLVLIEKLLKNER